MSTSANAKTLHQIALRKKDHMSCAALHKALSHTDQQAMTVSKMTSVK